MILPTPVQTSFRLFLSAILNSMVKGSESVGMRKNLRDYCWKAANASYVVARWQLRDYYWKAVKTVFMCFLLIH